MFKKKYTPILYLIMFLTNIMSIYLPFSGINIYNKTVTPIYSVPLCPFVHLSVCPSVSLDLKNWQFDRISLSLTPWSQLSLSVYLWLTDWQTYEGQTKWRITQPRKPRCMIIIVGRMIIDKVYIDGTLDICYKSMDKIVYRFFLKNRSRGELLLVNHGLVPSCDWLYC